MIGSGLKKLAAAHNMRVSHGVAYGSLCGYAATLSEGAGFKQIYLTTKFVNSAQQFQLQQQLDSQMLEKEFRVQEVTFSPNLIHIKFLDNPGTMKRIYAFIDWFFPLLDTYGATRINICTECGCEITAGHWTMVDGVAYHLHDSCAQKIHRTIDAETETNRQEERGSYVSGLFGALLGAVLGAVVWGLILNIGMIASLIGFLIGWLAEKGYTLFHGKRGKGKIAILLLAVVFGVFLGTIAGETFSIISMIRNGELYGWTYSDIPLLFELLFAEPEYVSIVARNALGGLWFGFLGAFVVLWRTRKEVAETKVIDLK